MKLAKFIYEVKAETVLTEYLDSDPHPIHRLVSVSIFESARYSTYDNKTVYAGITWEVDDSKILKQSTGPM